MVVGMISDMFTGVGGAEGTGYKCSLALYTFMQNIYSLIFYKIDTVMLYLVVYACSHLKKCQLYN